MLSGLFRGWFLRLWMAVGLILVTGLVAVANTQSHAAGGVETAETAPTASNASCAPELLGSWVAKEITQGMRPAQGWVPVVLPHETYRDWPQWMGAVWYRLDWNLHCPQTPAVRESALALAISGIRQAGSVYWNDELLWRDRSLTAPMSLSWNMPRWWPVSTQGHEGVQTAWIRVVAENAAFKGVGYVQLGDMASIQEDYASRYWHQRLSYVITASLSLTIACVALVVWLWRRSEKIYLWMGLMELSWTLYLSVILSLEPWFGMSSGMHLLLNLLFFMLYTHCFSVFALRFCGQSKFRLEIAGWLALAIWVACLLLLNPIPPLMSNLSLMWGVALFNLSCLYIIYRALRTREPRQLLLAAACVVMIVVSVHDIQVALRHWDNDQTWSFFSWPLNMIVLAVLLGWQIASHMRKADQFTTELTEHVEHARAELAQLLAQQHAKDLQSAKLQERVQLAHDLHDGLGGSLVRSLALVEQAPQQLSNERVMSLLKTLRDDLRQVIDSGSSSGVTVPETPKSWVAPLRHRFTHILDELDMQAHWRVDDQWRTTPSAFQCLSMLRFLEEAFANIIKHSRAQQVTLVCTQPDAQTWVLSVQDDGTGFDWDAVQQAGMSVGMRSMQARVARIGGTVQVQSQPGCTLLTACITLKAAPL